MAVSLDGWHARGHVPPPRPRRRRCRRRRAAATAPPPPPAGFHAPHVNPVHQRIGVTLGAIMWFWVFYRAREDGPVVLGWRHPWDHGEAHGVAHGEAHGVAHGVAHGDDSADGHGHGGKAAQLH